MMKICYQMSEYNIYAYVFDDGDMILLMLYVDKMLISCYDISKIDKLNI